ncbi:MAG: DUF3014 domain-containing protein [Vicinamibacterales bacterium]
MSSFDDLPLDQGRDATEPVTPSAPSSPGPRIVAVIALAAAVAAGAWYLVSRPATSGPTAAAATTPPAPTAIPDEHPDATPLPPLAEMDPLMREFVSALSTHPSVLAWLATDDLVGSLATTIDRLAQGRSPARDLAVLRPKDGFGTVRRSNVTQVDPKSYARYTPVAQAVASIDATRAAEFYERIQPRLDEAWRVQGHPEGGLDEAVRRALATVTTTPDIPADAALVPAAGGLKYADPAYENLPEAQKHLARMGPANVQLVRDAARRLGAAIDARRRTR